MPPPRPTTPPDARRRSDEELLRLVVAGREGDATAREAACHAWKELLVRDLPRVRGIMAAWSMTTRGGVVVRVEREDREDALQHVFLRLLRMLDSFESATLPQFRAAVNTCVRFACTDVCRARMTVEMGEGGSLDEPAGIDDPTGDGGRFDDVVAERSELAAEAQERGRELMDATLAAIERLPSENMRIVARMTLLRATSREIADETGLTVSNIDQIRGRALRRMRGEVFPDGE